MGPCMHVCMHVCIICMCTYMVFVCIACMYAYSKPQQVGNRIKDMHLLLKIEAIGFPTFGLLLYVMCVCVCVCRCMCKCICTRISRCMCMHACLYVTYGCMYVRKPACIYACGSVCLFVCVCFYV